MTIVKDWSPYAPYFTEDEFRCKHTGRCLMTEHFMTMLSAIRSEYGKPMRVTSGYRDPSHPVEAGKVTRGEHTYGCAADIAVEGIDAMRLLQIALKHGVSRIGVQQKGSGRFIHLGVGAPGLPNPALWSY